MNIEAKTLMFNALVNFINSIVKFTAGVLFNFSTSIADSIYSFSDFITDLMDIFGIKIASKKPTPFHPFGFGRIEYITNLFVGIMLFIIGLGIFMHSFDLDGSKCSIFILIFISISIILKVLSIIKLEKMFKKTKSKVIYMNIEEAKLDIFSSTIVFVVVILSNFSSSLPILSKSAMVGSIIISILIIKSSYELLKENILILLGAVDNDEEKIQLIKNEIEQLGVKTGNIELIRYGSYYKIHLVLNLEPNMTIVEAKKIQLEVVKELKRIRKFKVKFVNIDLDVVSN